MKFFREYLVKGESTFFALLLLALCFPFFLRPTVYPFRTLIPLGAFFFFLYQSTFLPQTNLPPLFFTAEKTKGKKIATVFILFIYWLALYFWGLEEVLFSIPISAFFLIWVWQGWERTRYYALGTLFLLFLLPTQNTALFILPLLQKITLWGSQNILEFMGYMTSVEVDTILYKDIRLQINPRCSGLGFFNKLTIFSLFVGLLGKLSLRYSWQLLILAPFFAIIANLIRVTLLFFVSLNRPSREDFGWWDVILGSGVFFSFAILLAMIALFWQKKSQSN